MTITLLDVRKDISVSSLKAVKNSVIGNPSAKRKIAQDADFIATLVGSLSSPLLFTGEAQGSKDDVRIEAAHIIASIAHGSQDAVRSLLRADAHKAFLHAIAKFQPLDPVPLKASFARALRALAVAIADAAAPSQWGLAHDHSEIKVEAKAALDTLFQIKSLDIYLPLLVGTSSQTSTYIAELLASTVRSREHRIAVSDWLPHSERIKEVKGKRGWEKPDMAHSKWVSRNLSELIRSRDLKLQEAALSALAAIAKDNAAVAELLVRPGPDRDVPPPLTTVLALTKNRSTEVQVAACLCATHIIRASNPNHYAGEASPALSVLFTINEMIGSAYASSKTRTKACFILHYLVTDDSYLCQCAVERESLDILTSLVKSITPLEDRPEWDQDEPDTVAALREAALTAVAALALFDHETRRSITDKHQLIPYIYASLAHHHPGVRYAACQCVRVLSREVAVIRTNIMDSGLGMRVFEIFKKEDEDRRVTYAATSAICNIVADFSPLQQNMIAQGLLPRLQQLLNSSDPSLRLNALWAFKNLVRRATIETKRNVTDQIGWVKLASLLNDPDVAVQEQAWAVVRNIAVDESSIDMVFTQFDAVSDDALLGSLAHALQSETEDVVLQAAYTLANLANGDDKHQLQILRHARIMAHIHMCLEDGNVEVCKPAVSCVLQLVRANPRRRKELNDAGITSTLRRISERGGGVSVSTSPGGARVYIGASEEVREKARQALDCLDHADE
ncbi:hypothetical protein PLICRDRAFT_41422 [Plicaturopsis crispa FD-325 SS-3]|nr:hypothetical protein PLICRDRAFT_41422 [Plicaturopsis crispa FD-325 SS-3]